MPHGRRGRCAPARFSDHQHDRRRLVVVVFTLVVLTLVWPVRHAAASPDDRILILNSYHPQYRWTEDLVRGALATLRGLLPPENVHVEYMDARRMVDDPRHAASLRDLYEHKYARFPPDVILASDDMALEFLLAHRDELFVGTPIVFCGVNAYDAETLAEHDDVTGILEGVPIRENLEMIHDVHPDAERVVLISDRTSLGKGMTREAMKALAAVDLPQQVELWDDFSLAELEDRMAQAGSNVVFLVLAILEDSTGRYFAYEEHLRPLTDATGAPVYAMWGSLIGRGPVGGMMNDATAHGREAARLVRRVLEGEDADDIPITTSAYEPRFDAQALARLNIEESRLPSNARVENRPFSFYRTYRALVWTALTIVLAMVGVIAGLLVIIRRMRRAERDLLASREELSRAHHLEALGRLAGGVAHDFNNLLVPVLTCSEALMMMHRGGEAHRALMTIHQSGMRARELITRLLAFGRVAQMSIEPVFLPGLVSSLRPLLERFVDVNSELVVDPGEHIPAVMVDRAQIERIIVNLVSNAADAARPPGPGHRSRIEVRLRCENVDDAAAIPRELARGTYVVLTVEDNGTGMSPEVRARVFEPFYTTKSPERGMGLGLASVVGIVERHGGVVELRSELGEGTRFDVWLPATDEMPRDLPASVRAFEPVPPCRILVVEDDPLVRIVLVETLTHQGHAVVAVADGDEALGRLHAEPSFDVVLSDINMPRRTGVSLAHELSELDEPPALLFMTGRLDTADEISSSKSDPVLRKPFTAEELQDALQRVLHERRRNGGSQGIPSQGGLRPIA